ncbi:transposase [Streptomyces globisporus]|uniref:transposase n=1 Tax=Streptomyces globisporus TaxID=1908 RepID=UPI001F306EE9|nr:transposase [Streptomyces globisporus]
MHLSRCSTGDRPEAAARHTPRLLAGRILHLTEEISDLTKRITAAIGDCAPKLLDVYGVGPDTAAALLTAVGDNPQRMGSGASFAALCGASPVEASSGKTQRRSLNRGGGRQANSLSARSSWPGCAGTLAPAPTSNAESAKERHAAKPFAASSATSPARSTSPSSRSDRVRMS